MSKVIKIKKGLDIKLKGKAELTLTSAQDPKHYALKPTDFPNLTPKLAVKVGDEVKAGSTLFYDKYRTEIKFASSVSGKVLAVNRGERRRILEVVVESDANDQFEAFKQSDPSSLSREEIIENLLASGLWPFMRQRPYAVIANPKDEARSIYVSAFDSSPLAPDYDFMIKGNEQSFQTGLNALSKLTSGKVHLNIHSEQSNSPAFTNATNVEITKFSGKHPTGNVGVQINHIEPINKGETVWYMNPMDVVFVGRLFETGKYDVRKAVALTGAEVKTTQYYNTKLGVNLEGMLSGNLSDKNKRTISGNVLTGERIEENSYLGFYDSQVTVIEEGDQAEFLGWGTAGFSKYSTSRSFFSWLSPNKEYSLDSNLHGGARPFVMSGEYERVFPMSVMPVQLLKAIIVEDIDLMEQLGIYEVAEEDFALCEFVCTSKIESQRIVRQGIDIMLKEFS